MGFGPMHVLSYNMYYHLLSEISSIVSLSLLQNIHFDIYSLRNALIVRVINHLYLQYQFN